MRQLAPFLILGFGLGLDRLCARSRFAAQLEAAAAAVLVINSVATFARPLSQQFPRDFKLKSEALLGSRPAITDGKSYYRLVNVDHYLLEPEILREEPMETLLASPHPLQYLPYLYDLEPSREMKELRLSIDHRMRLVRMAVPDAERVRGSEYGVVKITLELPEGRAGHNEPLLSVGPKGNGDLFFLNYGAGSTAVLGYMNMGNLVIQSAPFAITPGKQVVFDLFSGALMPGNGAPPANLRPEVVEFFQQYVYAAVDGMALLGRPSPRHTALPGDVFAGVNVVDADSAGDQFTGRILGAERGGWPPEPKDIAKPGQYGPLRMTVLAPAASNGTAEPLVVVGVPGRAVLGYMRIFPDGRACFGMEIWGIGAFEGNPMTLDLGSPLEVEYSFGSLYPEVGLPGWNDLPVERQMTLKHTLRVLVNGQVAFELEKDTPDLGAPPIYFGRNPVGGSLVNSGFSGHVLAGHRLEVDR